MKASRSLGSTTAPHLIILSTSLVQAFLLSRCCRMMPASWHSAHAVCTFDCIGPGGRSADCAETRIVHENAMSPAKMAAQKAAKARTSLCLNMNLHLVDGIVEVPTRIPRGSLRLRPALTV